MTVRHRVLVTGHRGFLGRAVLARLAGADVVTLDGDVRDREAVARAAAGCDGIVHLAALTRVRESFADPVRYFDVNLGGTLSVLAGAPEGARVVLASTASVYGSAEGAVSEDAPPAPANPYAQSKLAAEQLLAAQAATGRVGGVALRCFNLAGPGDRDLSRLIPKTLAVAAGTADGLTINGDGGAVREFTHVEDAAEAFALALGAAAPGTHRTLNVGTGEGATVAEVVATVRAVSGREVPAVHRPPAPEARLLVADGTRIRAELGWRPSRSSLDRIVRDGWAAIA